MAVSGRKSPIRGCAHLVRLCTTFSNGPSSIGLDSAVNKLRKYKKNYELIKALGNMKRLIKYTAHASVGYFKMSHI